MITLPSSNSEERYALALITWVWYSVRVVGARLGSFAANLDFLHRVHSMMDPTTTVPHFQPPHL